MNRSLTGWQWAALLALIAIGAVIALASQPWKPSDNRSPPESVLGTAASKPATPSDLKATPSDFGRPHIEKVEGKVKLLKDVKVLNFNKLVYEGDVDLNPTLERIRDGKKLDHNNDGAYFRNREELLPIKRDREYYREFVVSMKGLPFPGPQRLILGKGGEIYYTADHYQSFERVRQ